MKECEYEHYLENIVYLMEQTSICCKTKGEELFKKMNVGITLDQFLILDTISASQGLCQIELANLILKDRSYTSRQVSVLEEKGFVDRKIDTKGKRLIKGLNLTAAGVKMLEDYQDRLKQAYFDAFKDFSDEEFQIIRNGLTKMKDCITNYEIPKMQ